MARRPTGRHTHLGQPSQQRRGLAGQVGNDECSPVVPGTGRKTAVRWHSPMTEGVLVVEKNSAAFLHGRESMSTVRQSSSR
jgi:hypothetical protein